MPRVVILASNVTLSQRLCGTRPMARSPRGARARSRVKVVGVAVSSRKTKRCGAMRGQVGPPPLPGGLVALGGDQGLFLSGSPSRASARDMVAVLTVTPVRRPPSARSARPAWHPDGPAPGRAARARPPRSMRRWRPSRGVRRDAAGLAPPLLPAADGSFRDAKGAGGLRLCQPGVQGAQQAVAKVGRVLFHPGSFAPGQLLCNPL